MKYNRAFILNNESSIPVIQNILDNTGDEDLEYWIKHSKESFHGDHDDAFFYFKDSRIETGTKLPLNCVELEFTDEDLNDKE